MADLRPIVIVILDNVYYGSCSPGDEDSYVVGRLHHLGWRAASVRFRAFCVKETYSPKAQEFVFTNEWAKRYEL